MNIVDPRIPPTFVPQGSRAQVINGPHKEYRDLPSIVTPQGAIISRWTFTPEERAAIANGEDLYITVFGHRGVINPMFATVGTINWNEVVEAVPQPEDEPPDTPSLGDF